MNKKEFHFKILPYVCFDKPLCFNINGMRICVSSYKKDYQNKIPKEISRKLDKWVEKSVDFFDSPLKDISVVYFEDKACQEDFFSETEDRVINWIVQVICFAFTCMPFGFRGSANNFKSEYINIKIPSQNEDYYSIVIGKMIVVGLKYDKNKIHPRFYVKPRTFSVRGYEEQIIVSLETLIAKASVASKNEHASNEYVRILRAIGWFNMANYQESYEEPKNQTMMMSIAFESLIDTPREKVTEYFKNVICQFVAPNDDLKKWADKFYALRSDIVHGRIVNKNDLLYGVGKNKHVSHYYLSKLIFLDILLTKLVIFGFLDDNPLFKHIRVSKINEFLLSNEERFKWIIHHEKNIVNDAKNSDFESKTFKLLSTINIHEEYPSVNESLCDQAVKSSEQIKSKLLQENVKGIFIDLIDGVIERIREVAEQIKYRI